MVTIPSYKFHPHLRKKGFSMKKPIIICLAIIALLGPAGSLCAQIYKYIDEKGQPRWTDDLSQVPAHMRETAKQFTDLGDESQGASISTDQRQVDTKAVPVTDPSNDNAGLTRELLMKEKSNLENQYQQLVEERKTLETVKAVEEDAVQQAELNQRIISYNEKTKQYETRLNAYMKKVDAYNKKVMTTGENPAP